MPTVAPQASSAQHPPAAPGESPPAIVTEGLSKRYGQRQAVTDLRLSVPHGVVAGFVGPNGSGKTTTIRMLLGLIAPTAGTGRVLNMPITEPWAYLPRVGALIEEPAFYPSLSGRDNLATLVALGGHDPDRIQPVLELVGLGDRGGDRYRSYSLGMKQRLGIAAAVLHEPALLVLDEPANGLDPSGILEVRSLLQSLARAGTTVFVSSHLLSEIEQIAEWLVMIKDGRLLFQGAIGEVLGHAGHVLVAAPEDPEHLQPLGAAVLHAGVEAEITGHRLRVHAPPNWAGQLHRLAVEQGVTLVELRSDHANLEDTFLTMTRER